MMLSYVKHQTMKLLLTLFTFLLLACNQRKPAEQQQPQMPKALEEKESSDFTLISKSRIYNNLTEDLYNEIIKTDKALFQLETDFDAIDDKAADSLKTYNGYTDKNNQFYISAKEYAAGITDSSLKKQMQELLNRSETAYNKKISSHEQLIKKKEELAAHLKNLHSVLMLAVTLPVIEKYQKEHLPSTKPLNAINNQYTTIIQKADTLIKKQ